MGLKDSNKFLFRQTLKVSVDAGLYLKTSFSSWSEGIPPHRINLGLCSLPGLDSGLIPEILQQFRLSILYLPAPLLAAYCVVRLGWKKDLAADGWWRLISRDSELWFDRNYSMENVDEIWWRKCNVVDFRHCPCLRSDVSSQMSCRHPSSVAQVMELRWMAHCRVAEKWLGWTSIFINIIQNLLTILYSIIKICLSPLYIFYWTSQSSLLSDITGAVCAVFWKPAPNWGCICITIRFCLPCQLQSHTR